uniref:Uncharacterized protein n=1 Tax=viral metagenome TaxID=1070528 RepID=A0A6C0L7L8_9ZZZZ
MKSIRDTCIEFFQNEDTRKDMKEILKPLANIVYNEVYLYLWLLCFYNLFLFFIILAILVLLLRVSGQLMNFSKISGTCTQKIKCE